MYIASYTKTNMHSTTHYGALQAKKSNKTLILEKLSNTRWGYRGQGGGYR
jgi:hypothetical protein